MRDIRKGDDPQILATLEIIRHIDPDILLLTDIDWDYDARALTALANALGTYPYPFTAAPNAGVPSGHDLDANGRWGEARDALGYGRFTGDGGMAILSRFPVTLSEDHTNTLWRDVPGATLPQWPDGTPFPKAEAQSVMRLSSAAHWELRIDAPDGPLTLMAWSATPPVFDGEEDANGLRSRDEALFWLPRIALQENPFILIGNGNLDPADGDGDREAIAALLSHPDLQDPLPSSLGGAAAADPDQQGDPALDTADWPDDAPGNLRVSYVLPSTHWTVTGSGVFWPAPESTEAALLGSDGLAAGQHRLVWVDVRR